MRSPARLILGLSLLVAPGLLVAASAPMPQPAGTIDAQLAQATAEARAAEAEVERLEKAAQQARDEVEELRARQAAAAEGIAAAEARISIAEVRMKMIAGALAARRERLARQQEPAGALLAGLAMMASRPPMLAILDEGSTEEFVRVRLLLDSTLPVIRQRTAALSAEIEEGQRLQRSADAGRAAIHRERNGLEERRREFARLEDQALRLAEQRGTQALNVGDLALAKGEQAVRLSEESERRRSARQIAAELAELGPAPARPMRSVDGRAEPPLLYRLPASSPVVEGFGSVSAAGIRSRGLVLATARGTAVHVPASGIVRFAGPFRNHDGIVIIDHGHGWMSLVVNVSTSLRAGARVEAGQPLGRALGQLGVELSRNGRHVSPALIAGSYRNLSNGTKEG